MADAELQTLRDQIAFVNLSLEADPDNAELLGLRSDLEELIASSSKPAAPAAGPSKPTSAPAPVAGTKRGREANWQDNGPYKAGADCMAKYKDGKFYPARISAVSGSKEQPIYTITFKGYSNSTNVTLSSLRPHDPNAPIPNPAADKRKAEEIAEREKEKKKAKGEKWMEKQKAKADDVKEKSSAWQKFGKTAQRKGIVIAGLQGKSEFRTPDNPSGRVGVTGSGRGVTEYERMGKHKFDRSQDD